MALWLIPEIILILITAYSNFVWMKYFTVDFCFNNYYSFGCSLYFAVFCAAVNSIFLKENQFVGFFMDSDSTCNVATCVVSN